MTDLVPDERVDALRVATPPGWAQVAAGNLQATMSDHAHAEKKAALSALSLLSREPQRTELCARMAKLAREELRHLDQVLAHLRTRGWTLRPDLPDRYAGALLKLRRSGPRDGLVDRLLVAALIEARSWERLNLLGLALGEDQLGDFYRELARSEAGHYRLFVDLAKSEVAGADVEGRLAELADAGAADPLVRTPRDHSEDAGGDPAVLDAKRALRDEVWNLMGDAGAARFPGARGRIPNFVGAEAAAERLRGTDVWRNTVALKANPDSPQLPVRQRALTDGIVVFMAVPRLADALPFFRLDPAQLNVAPRKAASIAGASQHGHPVAVESLEPVDLVVTGSVAVDADGARLGKGGGFADLEFALAAQAGLIGPSTVVATTVHDVQVVATGRIPMTSHDAPLDLVVTPTQVMTCPGTYQRPSGVHWGDLTTDKIAAIPLLQKLHAAMGGPAPAPG
jgi:5-formyltetrahydrofolate cyclo-ligase